MAENSGHCQFVRLGFHGFYGAASWAWSRQKRPKCLNDGLA